MKKKYGKPPCIFKIDISSTRYEALLKRFDPTDMKIIDYYYFDLSLSQSDASLYQKGIRLRVNNKGRNFSLELKDRNKKPHYELKQKINLMQFSDLTKGVLPLGPIASYLNLNQRLYLVRTITVFRIKKYFKKGVLVLEKCVSAGHVTWQLEFRSCYQYLTAELYQMKKNLGVASKNNRSFTPKIIKVWDRTKLVQAIVI